MAELPYMKLWVDRFLGSTRVQALPGDECWRYLGLLVHEWALEGKGLPSNQATLARLLRIDVEAFKVSWEGGLSQFFELKKGRLFNKRLEKILDEELLAKSKHSKAGKLAAAMRWKNKNAIGNADALRSQCPPSPSPESYPKKDSSPGGAGPPLGAARPPDEEQPSDLMASVEACIDYSKRRKDQRWKNRKS